MTKIKIKLRKAVTLVALVSLATYTFAFGNVAYAGAMSDITASLSTTTPGASATHTITFTNASTTAIETVYIKYCTAAGSYDADCTAPTGLALPASSGVTLTGFPSATNTASGSANVETVTITTPGSETVQAHSVAIAGVTNPSAGVFYIRLKTTDGTPGNDIDTGNTASASIAAVTVSGTQLESLSVNVAAKTSGTVCGKTVLGTGVTASAVNFGTFNGTTSITGAHTVTIGTNAASGYTMKMEESGLLTNQSDGTKTIADFGGESDSSSGTAWNEGTSTGFGICATGTHANTTAFGAAPGSLYLKITNGSPKTIASYGSPVAETGTDIAYTVAVSSNLAAGTYTNTVNYFVLPQY